MSEKPGTFQKGDKRINRNGRPPTFDALRSLTREMFTRPALDSKGEPVLIENRPATIIEFILWKMIHSKDPRDVKYAIEIAYGKVPDVHELTGKDGEGIEIVVRYEKTDRVDPAGTSPNPAAGQA